MCNVTRLFVGTKKYVVDVPKPLSIRKRWTRGKSECSETQLLYSKTGVLQGYTLFFLFLLKT